MQCGKLDSKTLVSTHSRPKAAGSDYNANGLRTWSFNSQPPEGGWIELKGLGCNLAVSTHSRPKAAGFSHLNLS